MESTMETVEFSAPDLDASDVEAVADVVRSGRLALGPKAVEFERAMAEYVGAKHAIAVNSGTAGLHLLVRCLGIGPGDEVIVPSFTFAASANAVLFERATPVFADIEPETLNLDPADVRRKITARTKAIMAVDVFGHPVEWDALLAVADEFGLKIIDDSCEALGAEYRGKKLGTFGHAAAFAFYPNKQMTTGEGGIIVTNDDAIAEMCRSLRNQGRHAMGTWLEHHHLGYNYRMPDICAALGCSQLARIETFLAKRAAVAAAYTERLKRFEWLRPPVVRPDVRMSWFVYVVTLAEGLLREPIMRAMNDMGIPTRAYFSPLHRQPYIRDCLGPGPYELPVTDAIAPRTIALPFHNNLPLETIDRVVTALQTAVGRA